MVLIADNFNLTETAAVARTKADNFNLVDSVANTPNPVTGQSALPRNNAARLSWTPPTGTVITAYKVVATSASGELTYNIGSTTTTVDLTGLENAVLWTFSITALNNQFESTAAVTSTTPTSSDPLPDGSVPTVAPTVGTPNPPVLTALVGSNGMIGTTWTPPAFDGGNPVLSYVITAIGGGDAAQTQVITAPATTGTIGGLLNGVTYSVTVTARNSKGSSSPSNVLTVVPDAAGPPVPPPPAPPSEEPEPIVIPQPSLVAFLPQTPFAPAFWVGEV